MLQILIMRSNLTILLPSRQVMASLQNQVLQLTLNSKFCLSYSNTSRISMHDESLRPFRNDITTQRILDFKTDVNDPSIMFPPYERSIIETAKKHARVGDPLTRPLLSLASPFSSP